MKAASSALQAALAAHHEFAVADLYAFSLADGSALNFSGLDGEVTVGAVTYIDGALRFKRSQIKQPKGIQVSSVDIEIYTDATAVVGSSAFLPFAASGGLDGATVAVSRMMVPTQGYASLQAAVDALGVVTILSGRVSSAEFGRTSAKVTVKSWPELLNIMMPRNLFQAPCVHSLFDPGCALAKAPYAVSGTVGAGSTQISVAATLAQASGYFSLGEIVFTSGANAGLTRTIRTYIAGSPGSLALVYPLPKAPASGDTFTVYPGCDKQQATCSGKFGNVANFRGYPYVPNMETSI